MIKFPFLPLLFGLLIFSSCRKEKTSWDSAWTLPLVSDSLKLNNLVTDSILALDGTGYYQLAINRDILDIGLADYVEIPDTTVIQKYALNGSLNVNAGTSFVNNSSDHDFNLDEIQLKKARISSGKIYISVESPIETKTIFTVKLPGVKKNGIAIQKVFYAPAGTNQSPSVTSDVIDLSGYDIDLTGTGGSSFNKLQSVMVVQTDPTGNSVTVNNQDSTKFIVKLSGLKFDYARGYFGNLIIEDTSDLNLDFLSKITGGSLDLPNTNLSLSVLNSIKVGAKATIQSLENTNYNQSTISLTHAQMGVPFYIEPASNSWSNLMETIYTIQFTSANSNIEQYIENLGFKQNIAYRLELNPYGNLSAGWDEFFPTSRLKVRLKANMPLSVGLSDLTFQDTFKLELEQDKNKSNVLSGKLKLKVSNAFPLQGSIQLNLLDANGQWIETVQSADLVKSAIYGTLNASNLMAANSELEFQLPESLIDRLAEIKFISVKAILNTPEISTGNSTLVLIPEGAFIAFKLSSSFQLETKF